MNWKTKIIGIRHHVCYRYHAGKPYWTTSNEMRFTGYEITLVSRCEAMGGHSYHMSPHMFPLDNHATTDPTDVTYLSLINSWVSTMMYHVKGFSKCLSKCNMVCTDFTSLCVNPHEEILVVIIPIQWNASAWTGHRKEAGRVGRSVAHGDTVFSPRFHQGLWWMSPEKELGVQ